MSSWNSKGLKQKVLDRLLETQESRIGIQAYQLSEELQTSKSHVIQIVARLRDEGHPIVNEDFLNGPYLYGSPTDIKKIRLWRLSRFDLAIKILDRTRKTLKRIFIDDDSGRNKVFIDALYSQLESTIKILKHERNELRKIKVDA